MSNGSPQRSRRTRRDAETEVRSASTRASSTHTDDFAARFSEVEPSSGYGAARPLVLFDLGKTVACSIGFFSGFHATSGLAQSCSPISAEPPLCGVGCVANELPGTRGQTPSYSPIPGKSPLSRRFLMRFRLAHASLGRFAQQNLAQSQPIRVVEDCSDAPPHRRVLGSVAHQSLTRMQEIHVVKDSGAAARRSATSAARVRQ